MKKILLATAALLLNISIAYADGELESRLDAFLVSVNEKGEEVVRPAKEAEPGQVLEYRLVYSNKSEGPFSKLRINGLIPANTEYLAKSAASKVKHQLLVSFDGGANYHFEPAKRLVKQADGSEKEEVVPASDYTNLRWKSLQDLPAGKQQTYVYRVRVK